MNSPPSAHMLSTVSGSSSATDPEAGRMSRTKTDGTSEQLLAGRSFPGLYTSVVQALDRGQNVQGCGSWPSGGAVYTVVLASKVSLHAPAHTRY